MEATASKADAGSFASSDGDIGAEVRPWMRTNASNGLGERSFTRPSRKYLTDGDSNGEAPQSVFERTQEAASSFKPSHANDVMKHNLPDLLSHLEAASKRAGNEGLAFCEALGGAIRLCVCTVIEQAGSPSKTKRQEVIRANVQFSHQAAAAQ